MCEGGEPERMQDHAGVACAAYTRWNPRGAGGITNYNLHSLPAGWPPPGADALLHAPLARFCNEGSKRSTARPGLGGGHAWQGHVMKLLADAVSATKPPLLLVPTGRKQGARRECECST